jgi:hypothetical protein
MYTLSEEQIDFILNDIKHRGVEMEDLQLNLLDHICCVIECELEPDGNFENFYQKIIPRFFKKELKEIEEETILLLTFKNYYAMKKSMTVSGTVSVAMLILGSIFKIMHWPGAGVLLVLGIIISSLIFLPLMAILKNKEINVKTDKLILILGTIVGILFCNFVLFKVMHWPGADMLLFSSISLASFVFLPIYFFTGIRKPETRVNTITSSILLVMIIGLQFTLINTRPARKQLQIKMYNYIQSEELLAQMQKQMNDSTETKKLVDDINTKCQQIKSRIIENAINQKSIPKDFEEHDILIEEGGLGAGFFDEGGGLKLFSDLKTDITRYNTLSANKIPLEQSILSIETDKIGLYSNYSVLNSITQLQMYLANSERN